MNKNSESKPVWRARIFAGSSLVAVLLAAAPANATLITEHDTIGPLTNAESGLTTGGPFTFLTDSASFLQFDPTLGTLLSATLSWTITGSENGSGDYKGTGQFNFGGKTQTVTFDTKTDLGPKSFDFVDTALLSLASVTGTGSYLSPFTATLQQSGFFPWAGTMSLDSSQITMVYDYTPAGAGPGGPPIDAPEPATWLLLLAGIAGFAGIRKPA